MHIACWEAPYSDHYADGSSVQPTLQLLERLGVITSSHRAAFSLEQVVAEVRQWVDETSTGSPSVLYLAGHGGEGMFEAVKAFSQADFGNALKGQLVGRILHIGTCSSAVEDYSGGSLEDLRRVTKAAKVTGYRNDVDWVESSAFETLLFATLAHYTKPETALRYVGDRYSELVERLGFDWAGGR